MGLSEKRWAAGPKHQLMGRAQQLGHQHMGDQPRRFAKRWGGGAMKGFVLVLVMMVAKAATVLIPQMIGVVMGDGPALGNHQPQGQQQPSWSMTKGVEEGHVGSVNSTALP